MREKRAEERRDDGGEGGDESRSQGSGKSSHKETPVPFQRATPSLVPIRKWAETGYGRRVFSVFQLKEHRSHCMYLPTASQVAYNEMIGFNECAGKSVAGA